ncbi:hypothetical protein K432DRAFT_380244 [Lepidopterella palustris CBS 459.81]|uniref:Mitochondrial ATPase inhibitor n=1 Tax=Lepidopterella palustris CBS 459.81 TaxID=1314670 RepID=A0A8E2EES7_9PEZI|nr:hypothetical protein K432DRAFT_380244 [Lepidopterella palustris CBS 459.81]
MSAFRKLAYVTRPTPFVSYRFVQKSGIQTSTARFAGKESSLGHEGRAQEIDQHKEDLLKKQKEGKGHWKDELASDSESIVKADRGEMEVSEEMIKQLQAESDKILAKKKGH